MEDRALREDTGRVIAVAVALWACVVAIAAAEGAFARFEDSSLATFAALISLYSVAAYRLDRNLRGYAVRFGVRTRLALALSCVAALGASLAMRSAPPAMFFSPLAALAIAAAAGAWRRAATSGSSATSPGATPAAT
jgi:hypothetical protein